MALPSVLAFEKKIVPSDGLLFGSSWDSPEKLIPLKIIEKSIRGTISHFIETESKDSLKLIANVENANLQTIDTCYLPFDCDTLVMKFTLKFLGKISTPSSCNNPEFSTNLQNKVKAIEEKDISELSTRYAINIANSRYLWRNRLGAEEIKVNIKAIFVSKSGSKSESKNFEFDSFDFAMNSFDTEDEHIKDLARLISLAFLDKLHYLILEVECRAKIGSSQEVYPSEELVPNKEDTKKLKNTKSKILFEILGQAGMHSQKIGNAIRTIDTWYPNYNDFNFPIAIEPYGSVTTRSIALRNNRSNFYDLFKKFLDGKKIEKNDELYILAILIRGGILGGKKQS
ncbi:CRISPR protein, Cas7 [Taylorella equigenitalis 14/56]|uniref:CRISPR protein, Cas7 n=1 Tax=Taylorella equigenitalis 14/56 TaxID=1091497 RepID=I7J035_9BURK|nr:type I-F CRISPR-associated protein Csy3 [Taylorella equigenitalis]ASY29991.1 CRISPR-associated protein Csy3 [Taylorella equigenitalis]KOS59037.1 CRISPR-associated protein Cas7 [Taylorella equigenitalis]CCG18725.1 CRISPR protein, Cas7 [Taylorella equigenitalis 14/56]